MARDAPLEVDGVAYRLSPLARRGGRVALSCEPPPGAPIPDYARRVRIRARLDPRALVVFTDAARSAEVWCRGGRERIRWPGQPEPLLGREEARTSGCGAIPAKVLAMAGLPTGDADPFAALRAALADPRGPDTVRAVWRSALALRVLDPAAGTGEWLSEARDALRSVHDLCLEQMAVWVGEVALGRERRRPEYLRDLRGALARAAEGREAILLRNLHGVARTPGAASLCRRRLARGSGLPPAAVRVRAGDPALGFATRADLARALVGLPDAGGLLRELTEEREALSRADALARSPADLLALEVRRAGLRRRLDRLARRGAEGGRPLHPFLEWPDRFHLVRGEEP